MSDQKAERIGPFILGETLGEGMTGKVKRAHHNQTKQQVAIKIINKSKLTSKPNLRRKVEREIAVMKLIDHPHLIKLYDVLQTRKYLFLIIEYVEGGELFDYIVQKGKLSEEEAFHFFKQIVEGVEYCHKNLICHRDLKPENLLLDQQNNIKIADFGMASLMSEDFIVETSCGSPHYASPEVITGGKYNGMMADVWSCGVILYALLAGTLPFDDENLTVLLGKVKKGVYKIPSHFEDDVKDLIEKMLCVNAQKRISIKQIKAHPWWKRMLTSSGESEEAPLLDMSEAKKTKEEEKEESEEKESDENSITDIDETLVDIMVSMGWQDRDKLYESLRSKVKNIETVTYRLLKHRSTTGQEDSQGFEINPKLKVSIANPLTDPVDPLDEMKRRIGEAEKLQQEHEKNQEKRQSFLSKIFKSKKKADTLASFELKSNKEDGEIISELSRVFNELKIGWNQAGPNLIRATCTENPVEFDVSMSRKDDGLTYIKFTLIKGNPYTADAIISILKDQLRL